MSKADDEFLLTNKYLYYKISNNKQGGEKK